MNSPIPCTVLIVELPSAIKLPAAKVAVAVPPIDYARAPAGEGHAAALRPQGGQR